MTDIRHFTASAIVLDDADQVLLVHHNKIGKWLYPGGHVDVNEDPAQAALREVSEETGITTEVIATAVFTHPALSVHPAPYTILEMPVSDSTIGPHRHIDLVYICRPITGDLTAQLHEVSGVRWVPVAEVAALDTPPELPSLIAHAALWAKDHQP